jgi:succinate dehydrogenase/fumarate reductase-like Fe-S protein
MAQSVRSRKADNVVKRMGKKLTRQMVGSLVGCVHCGMCTDSCHYVLANPDDPTYAPAHKADQIRKIFKRNFDWTGFSLGGFMPRISAPMRIWKN